MSRRVRIGLAGLGRMGAIHAANLSGRCPAAELACVFDADTHAARQASEQFGVPAAGSFADMLADPSIDAVAIATPTATHACTPASWVTSTCSAHAAGHDPAESGVPGRVRWVLR